jgi:putative alpha-1,2-mannosidase
MSMSGAVIPHRGSGDHIPMPARKQRPLPQTLMKLLVVVIVLLSVLGVTSAAVVQGEGELYPEEYVNILGGTQSESGLSHGGTLPLIGRPWGFNTWAPYTNPGGGGWWFHPEDRSFYGLRLTHQPSPYVFLFGYKISG